jgi:hypothetical protein
VEPVVVESVGSGEVFVDGLEGAVEGVESVELVDEVVVDVVPEDVLDAVVYRRDLRASTHASQALRFDDAQPRRSASGSLEAEAVPPPATLASADEAGEDPAKLEPPSSGLAQLAPTGQLSP